MDVVVGRSPEQIREDELVAAHTAVIKALNAVTAGQCLYLGDRRSRLIELREKLESALLGEIEPPRNPAALVYSALA